MVKLRPPSYVKSIALPVFGLDWFGDIGGDIGSKGTSSVSNGADGTVNDNFNGCTNRSVVAYCGGGGSAKTGVNNKIIVLVDNQEITISTGEQVCVSIKMFIQYSNPSNSYSTDRNPNPNKIWLLGAIGNDVVRYGLPECSEEGRITVGGGCNALAVHAMGEVFAVGCEDGLLHVYNMATTGGVGAIGNWVKLFQCVGHEKAICSLQFANRSSLLVSSAKDGTCRVWSEGGTSIDVLTCDITDPKVPPPKVKPKRPVQVLVRGCAFGDLEGKVIYTVASGRKGAAFLTRWVAAPSGGDLQYHVDVRTAIHAFPISAMSLSADAGLLALGGVDGTILLFDVGSWSVLRQFKELHELPVTCIAARPYAMPLQGDGPVPIHAISASADSQMGMLTLITKVPRSPSSRQPRTKNGYGSSIIPSTFMSIVWVLLLYLFYTIGTETLLLCGDDALFMECLHHTVLIAPSNRPGIRVPPY